MFMENQVLAGRVKEGNGPAIKLLFVTPERLSASPALGEALKGLYNTVSVNCLSDQLAF
jgi:hypothetical protein